LTWLKSIDKDFPVVSVTNPDDVMEKARLLADQNDFVVIDGPGQVSELNRTILLVADVAVIPCQPAGLDLHSTHGVFRLVRSSQQVRGGKPTAVCYLSRAVPNTRLKNETAAALSQIERVKYLPFVIHHRQVITDCFGQEASLWTLTEKEAKRSAKTPIREYEALFQAILEESYE
jgi:chromosome partitioning protein